MVIPLTLLKCIQHAKPTETLVNSLLTKISCKVVLQALNQEQMSKETEQLFTSLAQAAQGGTMQLRCCLQVLADSLCSSAVSLLQIFKACLTSPAASIQQESIAQTFQAAHDSLAQKPDDEVVSPALETI